MLNESPHGVVSDVLDCHIEVSEFELRSLYYIYCQSNTLGKGINFLTPSN